MEHKYNRQSERIETKDQNGTIHTFEYDKLGRQTADKATTLGANIDNAVRRVERDYEVRGMLEKATNYDAATGGFAVNEVELSYNDFGQPEAEHQEHDGETDVNTPQVQYAHADGTDNHARLTSITYPNGRVLHHEYSSGNDNNLGRVSYLSDVDANGQHLADYTYLEAGKIVKVDYTQPDLRCNLAHGAGDDPYDGLDRFGRVVDLLWRDYGSSADAVRVKHGYDRASNRLWREDTVSKSQGTPVYLDERYTYDGMYQLAALQRGQLNANEDGLVAESKTFAEQWTLDPTGNWGNFKQDPDGDDDWDLDQNRTHNEANEIATIAAAPTHVAHDRSGNMIRAPKPSDWADHYHLVYDAWNRLVEVRIADESKLVAAYEYDGLGRRTVKQAYDANESLTDWRHYYYSNQWQVLEERGQGNYYSGSSSSAGGPAALERQYVWGLRYVDDLICRDRDEDGNPATGNYGKTGSGLEERLYAMQDANWNVVAISGSILERYLYDAYGKPTFLTSAFVIRDPDVSSYSWTVLYTGRQYDANTGLYDYRRRPYHSLLGRFLNRDPIGYDAGDMSLYRYVWNNPLTRNDFTKVHGPMPPISTLPPDMKPLFPPGPRRPRGGLTQADGCEHPFDVGCAIDKANEALAKPECRQWFKDHGFKGEADELPSRTVRCHSKWRINCWMLPYPTWTVPGQAIHVCDWAAEKKDCEELATLLIHELAHHYCPIIKNPIGSCGATTIPLPDQLDPTDPEGCAMSAQQACDVTINVPLMPNDPDEAQRQIEGKTTPIPR